MRIISICRMGPGTFEAKFTPLAKLEFIEKIFVVRIEKGPQIDKLEYIILPSYIRKFKILKIFIPFILAKHTVNTKSDLIIGYHIIPHAFYAFFASLMTKVPFACAQTGLDIQKFSSRFGLHSMLKVMFRKALFFNVPGQMSKDFWINFGVNPRKIKLLHSTIDTEFYSPGTIQVKDFEFIFLGRLAEVKNLDIIIKAFNRLVVSSKIPSKPRLVIVGDGTEREKLELLVSNFQLEKLITFTGFVVNPVQLLQRSRFLIMASTSEGLPTAMMQAMACHVLPITNLVGNIPDLITHKETGFTYNLTNEECLSEAMINALLTKDDELIFMMNRARDIVIQRHSHTFAMKQWKELFSDPIQVKKISEGEK